MRWYWVDRFTVFEQGKRAEGLKAVSMSEEQIDGYNPGFPYHPPALIVEGLAQTGGTLIGELGGYRNRVVLAKIGKAVFDGYARPGDTLRYVADVETIQPDGAVVKAAAYCNDHLLADVEMMFAKLDDERFADVEFFDPVDLLAMLRSLRIYEIGVAADGGPLKEPQWMLDAEIAAQGASTS